MRRVPRSPSLVAALGVAATLAACGSAARTATTPGPGVTTPGRGVTVRGRGVATPARIARLTRTPPARLRGGGPGLPSRAPALGATQRTSYAGATLSISAERLIDPLRASGASVLPGQRLIGVLVELTNAGPALYDSSATGDFSVIVSRGSATPAFVPRGICRTPVEDFDRYMTAGVVRTGCVAFTVDDRARVLAVRFSPHDQPVGRLLWRAGAA